MNFDPLALSASVDAWIHANPYALAAVALATAHRKAIFKYVVLNAVKKWPWLLGKQSEILADIDEFRADLKDAMDAAAAAKAAADAAKAAAAPAPVPLPNAPKN